MYNSSLKGKGKDKKFSSTMEIPHKIFFNDMSKNYMREEFRSCDCIYSEVAWIYGYKGFNEKAGNEPNKYMDYIDNIARLVDELKVPAFIICGKNVKSHFTGAKMAPIVITTSGENIKGCTLYYWNYDLEKVFDGTHELTDFLAQRFNKCLDFSCGYGEHLLKFKDFIACDINSDCLTYLSVIYSEQIRRNAK